MVQGQTTSRRILAAAVTHLVNGVVITMMKMMKRKMMIQSYFSVSFFSLTLHFVQLKSGTNLL